MVNRKTSFVVDTEEVSKNVDREINLDSYGQRKKEIQWNFVGNLTKTDKEIHFVTGSKYQGTWDDLGIAGVGRYSMPNGTIYEGELRDGVFHGHGTLEWPEGLCLDGVWIRGKLQEKRLTFPDGLIFQEDHWDYCQLPNTRINKCTCEANMDVNKEKDADFEEHTENNEFYIHHHMNSCDKSSIHLILPTSLHQKCHNTTCSSKNRNSPSFDVLLEKCKKEINDKSHNVLLSYSKNYNSENYYQENSNFEAMETVFKITENSGKDGFQIIHDELSKKMKEFIKKSDIIAEEKGVDKIDETISTENKNMEDVIKSDFITKNIDYENVKKRVEDYENKKNNEDDVEYNSRKETVLNNGLKNIEEIKENHRKEIIEDNERKENILNDEKGVMIDNKEIVEKYISNIEKKEQNETEIFNEEIQNLKNNEKTGENLKIFQKINENLKISEGNKTQEHNFKRQSTKSELSLNHSNVPKKSSTLGKSSSSIYSEKSLNKSIHERKKTSSKTSTTNVREPKHRVIEISQLRRT